MNRTWVSSATTKCTNHYTRQTWQLFSKFKSDIQILILLTECTSSLECTSWCLFLTKDKERTRASARTNLSELRSGVSLIASSGFYLGLVQLWARKKHMRQSMDVAQDIAPSQFSACPFYKI